MTSPRCIVEIRWGKLAGTKAFLAAGASLHVGRTDRADLVVAHDRRMSHVHFGLSWDGQRCILQDAGSIDGTRLNGEAVQEAAVPHGGWIQAGETDLLVYHEAHTPPRDDDDELDAEARRRRARRLDAAEDALETLRAEAAKEPLHAIVDAARDDRILELLREHVEPHRSLYEGAEGETLDEVAPYLVGPMQAGSALLEKLVMEGWGRRWGIWCTSREPFREVRRHWRRFLMVELHETRERVYFRFVDPGVLVPFMAVASDDQRAALLDQMIDIAAEHHDQDLEVWHAR
jgi:hypothetical protein